MRDRLALYVCPEKGCATTGRKDQSCPTHDKPFIREVYRREGALTQKEIADKLRETAERISGSFGGDPNLEEMLKSFKKRAA